MNPTYHSDARGLAFNVKCRARFTDDRGTEEQRERAYQRAQYLWWSDARQAAIQYGFTDVLCVGRSGGWLAPAIGSSCVDPDDMDTDTIAGLNALGTTLDAMMRETDARFTAALDAVLAEEADDRLAETQLAETRNALLDAVREYVRTGHGAAIEPALIAYDMARA